MLSQFAQFAHLFDVILEEASVDLRVTFDSANKYGLSEATTAFNLALFKISLRSTSKTEKVRALAEFAENACHAHKSFKVPVPVHIKAFLNNELLIDVSP